MGYIGPSVVKQLRRAYPQAKLIGLDIGYFGNCVTGTDILPECRVDVQYFADIRHPPQEALKGLDAVVHLAGISNDPIGNRFEEVTLDVNYRASVSLAEKVKRGGAKAFVFASSCSMYGEADDKPRTEKSTLNPLTAYARSKALTEKGLEKTADDRFLATSLRFSTACGMSERLRLDLVLNDFVACAITSKHITVLSDGTPWRPLINVKDMARAIDWSISRKASDGGEFLAVNVGSDDWNYQVKDLAEAVSKVIPKVDISINKKAQPDKRSYRVCFDLYKELAPNYQPKTDLIGSIRELKIGLETMGFANEDFRNSNLMRLKVLTQLREDGLLNDRLEWTKIT